MGEALIARILQAYGLENYTVGIPQKGYRNQAYPVFLPDGTILNLMLYKSEPGMLQRIRNANRVADYLAAQGFPARRTASTKILQLKAGAYCKYGALYTYLPGHTIPWEGYTQDHIKLVGKTMSDMHAALTTMDTARLPDITEEYLGIVEHMRAYFNNAPVQRALAEKVLLRIDATVFDQFTQLLVGSRLLPGSQPLHMDFVRSNILWNNAPADDFKVSVSGILDFEKTACGHPLYDIARTLAFLLVDCKYKSPDKVKKYFLGSGYIKRGAAVLPAQHSALLEPLVGLFLFYDFYKFLRHNPYESLPDNEHFMRTAELLITRKAIHTQNIPDAVKVYSLRNLEL
jgi:Ser/Thr protein kinase RdoA (MazF antagonist)